MRDYENSELRNEGERALGLGALKNPVGKSYQPAGWSYTLKVKKAIWRKPERNFLGRCHAGDLERKGECLRRDVVCGTLSGWMERAWLSPVVVVIYVWIRVRNGGCLRWFQISRRRLIWGWIRTGLQCLPWCRGLLVEWCIEAFRRMFW
jgi:hypothetical protein